ncbi:hypothetical protein AN394_01229 [Pseudoalteromonas sp. P1-26]|uniref:hypothetical protein n=1 Tax=Pseudoalteromonas sp. P1-26 TaxID=1723759 RepID=UPI0006D671A6|nr:hypothetical protein [Pseudoalteromonas sp. P1-26]KPZ73982.1 hypothetical protein AN394_01229 [Pseudoalteromonas sp. P1-26]
MSQLEVNAECKAWGNLTENFLHYQKVNDNNVIDVIRPLTEDSSIVLNNLNFSGELHFKKIKCNSLQLYSVSARKIIFEDVECERIDLEEVECNSLQIINLKSSVFRFRFLTSKDINITKSGISSLKLFDTSSPSINIELNKNLKSNIRDVSCDILNYEIFESTLQSFTVWNLDSKEARFDLPSVVQEFELYGYIKGACYFGRNNEKSVRSLYDKWLLSEVDIRSSINGDIQFHNFMCHNFQLSFSNSNRGSIDFDGISPFANCSVLDISSNRLENIKFYACDFNGFSPKYSEVSENSYENCISHGTTWPEFRSYDSKHHLNYNEYLNGEKYYYDSLGKMCEKSGDLFGRYKYSYLAKNSELKSVSHNSQGVSLDYVPLVLSKIFSRYNTSWMLVLLWLMVFNFAYFIFLKFSLHDLITAFNPLHKFESLNYVVDSKIISGDFYLVNFCMRLINSFLVFKFLKSFKKYY